MKKHSLLCLGLALALCLTGCGGKADGGAAAYDVPPGSEGGESALSDQSVPEEGSREYRYYYPESVYYCEGALDQTAKVVVAPGGSIYEVGYSNSPDHTISPNLTGTGAFLKTQGDLTVVQSRDIWRVEQAYQVVGLSDDGTIIYYTVKMDYPDIMGVYQLRRWESGEISVVADRVVSDHFTMSPDGSMVGYLRYTSDHVSREGFVWDGAEHNLGVGIEPMVLCENLGFSVVKMLMRNAPDQLFRMDGYDTSDLTYLATPTGHIMLNYYGDEVMITEWENTFVMNRDGVARSWPGLGAARLQVPEGVNLVDMGGYQWAPVDVFNEIFVAYGGTGKEFALLREDGEVVPVPAVQDNRIDYLVVLEDGSGAYYQGEEDALRFLSRSGVDTLVAEGWVEEVMPVDGTREVFLDGVFPDFHGLAYYSPDSGLEKLTDRGTYEVGVLGGVLYWMDSDRQLYRYEVGGEVTPVDVGQLNDLRSMKVFQGRIMVVDNYEDGDVCYSSLDAQRFERLGK